MKSKVVSVTIECFYRNSSYFMILLLTVVIIACISSDVDGDWNAAKTHQVLSVHGIDATEGATICTLLAFLNIYVGFTLSNSVRENQTGK